MWYGLIEAGSLENTDARLAAPADKPNRAATPSETIRLNRFGIEDPLTDMADEVFQSLGERSPLEDVLDELLL